MPTDTSFPHGSVYPYFFLSADAGAAGVWGGFAASNDPEWEPVDSEKKEYMDYEVQWPEIEAPSKASKGEIVCEPWSDPMHVGDLPGAHFGEVGYGRCIDGWTEKHVYLIDTTRTSPDVTLSAPPLARPGGRA